MRLILATALVCAASAAPLAQGTVTSPKQQFGHDIGADYELPNYTKFAEYWRKLEKESPRIKVVEIGKTAEGRPQLMSIVTSPENHKQLDRFRDISKRLAMADGLTDDQARTLAREGKSVIWIDGGLHATEVLGAQQLLETVYQLVSRTDAETLRILNDVIILAVHANPDGMELVSDWYMRNPDPKQRSTGGLPVLYEKYAGHDNNRDFYMSALPESTNMNRVMYTEWLPQIMYNHHQTGPQGTVMFAPPFRDPFNYNYHPLVPATIDLVGSAMATRFIVEDKPGVTTRRGASYSVWWNGGLRTTAYFHNIIGLLTETIGSPTPISIPFLPTRQLPDSNLFYPIAPQQEWKFRQSIDYSVTANYAVLDLASRYRETLLWNIYEMGRDSIANGNKDTWTPRPRRVAELTAKIAADRAAAAAAAGAAGQASGRQGGAGRGGGAMTQEQGQRYFNELRKPEQRDPRGYILPSNQADFGTATRFMHALQKNGVTVHRATAAFTVNSRQYPAGSYVIKTAQPFRPHVIDMFEPQDHPDDIPYPGGPPIAPYDSAGWTLAYQMGVQFDRVLEGFDGPFEKLSAMAVTPAGRVTGPANAPGYYFSHKANSSFIAINRLVAAREEVRWLNDGPMGAGTFYVTSKATTRASIEKMAAELGIDFEAARTAPQGQSSALRKLRIALYDRYGGMMPSGWTRLVFENFEFPFEVVYPQDLDAGNLRAKYDVIVFVDGAITGGGGGGGGVGTPAPEELGFGESGMDAAPQGRAGGAGQAGIPEEFRRRQGSVTRQTTLPKLREFAEAGGTIIAIGGSTVLGEWLGLPLSDHLVEMGPTGQPRPLPREKYFVPGSVLRASVDTTHPLAHGMPSEIDVFFDNSPVFSMGPEAPRAGIRPIVWFSSGTPLRSGWAWGQHYLKDGIAAVDAPVGRGHVYLFGPEIAFRAQPHGTFKFLFNALYLSVAERGAR
ncbi:MAG: M14 family metallopeptidase [Acidobacteriota bacterium]|nr:M14 family metallopeptidase [Acidobacteriota bacterium]